MSSSGSVPPVGTVRITPAGDETNFETVYNRLVELEAATPTDAPETEVINAEIKTLVDGLRNNFGIDVESGTLIAPTGQPHHVRIWQGRWVHAKELPTYAERAALIYPQARVFLEALKEQHKTEGRADFLWGAGGKLLQADVYVEKEEKVKFLGFIPTGKTVTNETKISLVSSKGQFANSKISTIANTVQNVAMGALQHMKIHPLSMTFQQTIGDKLLRWILSKKDELTEATPLLKELKRVSDRLADASTHDEIAEEARFNFPTFWADLLHLVKPWEKEKKTSYGLTRPDVDASWEELRTQLETELAKAAGAATAAAGGASAAAGGVVEELPAAVPPPLSPLHSGAGRGAASLVSGHDVAALPPLRPVAPLPEPGEGDSLATPSGMPGDTDLPRSPTGGFGSPTSPPSTLPPPAPPPPVSPPAPPP